MFKLLPTAQKEKVEKEYKTRRLFVFLSMLAVLVVCTLAGFFPTFVSTSYKKAALTDRLTTLSQTPAADGSVELKTWSQNVKKQLTLLSPKSDTAKPYEVFLAVLAAKPSGVRINGLSWSSKVKAASTLSIAGVAKNRQSLILFEGSLSSSKSFATTTFPISDLAGDSNIPFTLSLVPLS